MSDLSQSPITDKKGEEVKLQNKAKVQNQNGAKKEGKKKYLAPLVITLSIILLLVISYIVYLQFFKKDTVNTTNNNQQEEKSLEDSDTEDLVQNGKKDTDTNEDDAEAVEEESEYTTFTGEVITAQLPEGWSIVEYFDGEGTESLPDMGLNYEGLTAIDIINPDSLQVFTIQAVSGIGFAGCPNYALFDDDGEAYRLQQESVSDDMGEPLNITDYTGTDYVEFEFLGVTFRRIDDKYFYDTQEGNNYFEPPCVEGLLTLEGLYFTDSDEYKYESYFYGPTEDATEDDLPIVDEILESIELI